MTFIHSHKAGFSTSISRHDVFRSQLTKCYLQLLMFLCFDTLNPFFLFVFWLSLRVTLVVTMVMKSAVEDDDSGWGLGIPEKMKSNANWVDITHEFKGSCKGTVCSCECVCVAYMRAGKKRKGLTSSFFSLLVVILYLCRVEPGRAASRQTVSGRGFLFADSHHKGSLHSNHKHISLAARLHESAGRPRENSFGRFKQGDLYSL